MMGSRKECPSEDLEPSTKDRLTQNTEDCSQNNVVMPRNPKIISPPTIYVVSVLFKKLLAFDIKTEQFLASQLPNSGIAKSLVIDHMIWSPPIQVYGQGGKEVEVG